MDTLSYKTQVAKPSTVVHKWYIVDAENQTLGRISSEIAKILQGKNKPSYTTHFDAGDHVIIINADKLDFTVRKGLDKKYNFHSGFPGGLRTLSLDQMMAKDSTKVIELAIKGMLPTGRLGRQMIDKLHVYKGAEHPHQAQTPKEFAIKSQKPADKKVKA